MILNEILLEEFQEVVSPAIVFLCPNYEDRSIDFAKKITENDINIRIYPEILFLQNAIENSAVLDAFKYENLKKTQELFQLTDSSYHRINFPDNFSSTELNYVVRIRLEHCFKFETKINIILDISAMPRPIVLELCNIINDLKNDIIMKDKIDRVFFVYVSPKEYSQIKFPQEVGLPYGFFSGEPLYKNKSPIVHSIIFPGREGYESSLVLDSLSSGSVEHHAEVYFEIFTKDYLKSLSLMRANINIISSHICSEEYYCSLADGIRVLSERLDAELIPLYHNGVQDTKLFVIAPFNSKIMLPAAFFLLKKMKRNFPTIKVDISIMRTFQYISAYSLGVGKCEYYELNQIEYNEDIKQRIKGELL